MSHQRPRTHVRVGVFTECEPRSVVCHVRNHDRERRIRVLRSAELGRLHAVTLTGTAGTVVQTIPLTDVQAGFLRACQVAPPPRMTTLHPA